MWAAASVVDFVVLRRAAKISTDPAGAKLYSGHGSQFSQFSQFYEAVTLGMNPDDADLPTAIQERARSSSNWYTP
jgi:hypothetical protein